MVCLVVAEVVDCFVVELDAEVEAEVEEVCGGVEAVVSSVERGGVDCAVVCPGTVNITEGQVPSDETGISTVTLGRVVCVVERVVSAEEEESGSLPFLPQPLKTTAKARAGRANFLIFIIHYILTALYL